MNQLRNNPTLLLCLVAILALGLGWVWPNQLIIFASIATISLGLLLISRLAKAWPTRNNTRRLLKLAETLSFLGALIAIVLQISGYIEGYNGLSIALLYLGTGFLMLDRALSDAFLAKQISTTNAKIGIAIVLIVGFLFINWYLR